MEYLKEDFRNLMEDVPVNLRRNMWLQMRGGALAHFGRILNENFPARWIGREHVLAALQDHQI